MDYAAARRSMVENQLRTNRVSDPLVVAAMSEVPREAFVPPAVQSFAYRDEALPVGPGRWMMEPLALARLLQMVELRPTDLVLEVGCGTGYMAAVAARIASTVVGLESDGDLAAFATGQLAAQHVDAAVVVEGPLTEGYPKQAPYDVILFGGAVAEIPESILAQLAEGGRLAAIVRRDAGQASQGRGVLATRQNGVLSRREIFDLGVPFLPGFEPKPTFSF